MEPLDFVVIERDAAQSDTDSFEYVMSDGSVDRIGDIIQPDGWKLGRFKKNPVALYAHDRASLPIGVWENVRLEGERLIGRLRLAKAGTSEFIDRIRRLIEQRMLKAVSVGFKPIKYEPLDPEKPFGGYRFIENELLECSLCAVPANANALQLRSLTLPAARPSLLAAESGNGLLIDRAGDHRQVRRTLPQNGKTTMSLSERIQQRQDELIALLDKQAPLLGKVNNGDELTDEEQTEFDTYETEKAKLQKSLDTLRATERTLAGQSFRPNLAPAGGERQPGVGSPAVQRSGLIGFERGIIQDKARPADLLVRLGVLHLKAYANRKPLDDIRKDIYPDRPEVDAVIKAVTNPAQTTVAGWAAELVDTAILDFLEALLPISVYSNLRNLGIRFSFGRNGVIKIPRRNKIKNAPGDLRGAFVGEGQPIPVRRGSFGSVSLTPHKIGVISTFTREMANQSTPQIEGLIREGIVEDTADAIDTALLDAVAGDTIRPAGLLNGVTPIAGSAAATLVDKIAADVQAALAPFIAANAADRLVWLMNPSAVLKASWAATTLAQRPYEAQLASGNLAGFPVIQSTNVPATALILLRAADFSSSTADTPEFDVSDVATIHEEDGGYPADQTMRPGTSTTLPIVDPAGTAAKPVRSLWQTASIGIRMLLDMDWAMRRAGMVQEVSPISW